MRTLALAAVVLISCTPPAANDEANTFLITVTGEESATEGTGFPPAPGGGEPYFVDGWEIHWEHVLVTVGTVTLSEGPETNPNDQSVTGADVAQATGPWAVDLAQEGPLSSKEQNGTSWPLVRIEKQNLKKGSPSFDPLSRYAISYSLITADEGAQLINLDASAEAAYRTMQQNGWSVLLQGTATWRGDQGNPSCRSTDQAYDFTRFPRTVKFSFGFAAPVHFKNCVNPELQPGDSRGVQTVSNTQTIAQLTFHLDHPFWEALAEDAPLRWDALAARRSVAMGVGPDQAELTNADLSFDLFAPRDAQGAAIPWRTCGPVEPNERSSGSVFNDPVNVPVNPAGGATGLRDVADYMTYNLSTFGHLNNDGLCFPERQYPSPF